MPYWQLFYHIVWATKGREPVLSDDRERLIHHSIAEKATSLGAQVFAVNGVEDHVHMVVAIPPSIAVSTFIGQVKGASSAFANKANLFPFRFRWQEEYGVFSFDRKRLPYVVEYVRSQKVRHRNRTLISVLERVRSHGTEYGQVREEVESYLADLSTWESEMETL